MQYTEFFRAVNIESFELTKLDFFLFFLLTTYEGRSESSNNCLIIQLIFIVKQKESYLI